MDGAISATEGWSSSSDQGRVLGLPRRKVLESGDAAAAEVRKVALSSAGHAGAAAIGARVRLRRGPGAGLKTTELENGYGLVGSRREPGRLQGRRGSHPGRTALYNTTRAPAPRRRNGSIPWRSLGGEGGGVRHLGGIWSG